MEFKDLNLAELDKETRDDLLQFLGMLFKSNLRLMLEGMQEEAAERASRRQNRKEREEEV